MVKKDFYTRQQRARLLKLSIKLENLRVELQFSFNWKLGIALSILDNIIFSLKDDKGLRNPSTLENKG